MRPSGGSTGSSIAQLAASVLKAAKAVEAEAKKAEKKSKRRYKPVAKKRGFFKDDESGTAWSYSNARGGIHTGAAPRVHNKVINRKGRKATMLALINSGALTSPFLRAYARPPEPRISQAQTRFGIPRIAGRYAVDRDTTEPVERSMLRHLYDIADTSDARWGREGPEDPVAPFNTSRWIAQQPTRALFGGVATMDDVRAMQEAIPWTELLRAANEGRGSAVRGAGSIADQGRRNVEWLWRNFGEAYG